MELIPYSISELSIEAYLIKVTTKSRMIYWLIIGFVIAAIMILPFIYVDVSVQARGYFQSEIEKQIIYTPFQGKVSHISIHNGDRVKIGDTLIIIDIEAMRAQKASIMQSIAENDSSLLDLDKLTKINFRNNQAVMPILVTQRYKAELENLRNQFSIQYKKYQKKIAENERNEVLYKQQLIPKAEYENSLFSLDSEKENLDQVTISQKSLWQIDLTNRRNESVKLSANLTQYSQAIGERIVLSTTDGEIVTCCDKYVFSQGVIV
jgi:membrane fusion protein, peptide pheromone/bacteriocin exporter